MSAEVCFLRTKGILKHKESSCMGNSVMFYGLERQDDIYKVQYLLINIQSANIGKCKQVFFKTNVGNEAWSFANQFHLSNNII